MTNAVGAALVDDVLAEWYRYPAGPAESLPRHAHADYQCNLNLGDAGGLVYRGERLTSPSGTLVVVQAEEPHTPVDPGPRVLDTTHLTLYLPRPLLEVDGAVPWFREPRIAEPGVVAEFARVHRMLVGGAPALDRQVGLLELAATLAARGGARARAAGASPWVAAVRDRLHDDLAADLTLGELASGAGLSAAHLVRGFRAAVGVPPHTYRRHLRLERAKRLLAAGVTPSRVASEVGFFDLSHLTRHFRAYVGVPPGAYGVSENPIRAAERLVDLPRADAGGPQADFSDAPLSTAYIRRRGRRR